MSLRSSSAGATSHSANKRHRLAPSVEQDALNIVAVNLRGKRAKNKNLLTHESGASLMIIHKDAMQSAQPIRRAVNPARPKPGG